MKKLFATVALLVVAYLVGGAIAWRTLPAQIAEAERRRDGVTLALAKLADDQLAVSRRVAEITAQTLDRGRDKAEQVALLLADETLNRMALTYTGADWSGVRSSLVGKVKYLRGQQRKQAADQKKQEDVLEKKVEKIEYRKRQLLRNMNAPLDAAHQHKQAQWRAELMDLDRQLTMLRDTSQYREKLSKPGDDDAEKAKAEQEAEIYKLAAESEAQTAGKLAKAMADKASALKAEESEVERLTTLLSLFDVWPLNKLSDTPTGGGK